MFEIGHFYYKIKNSSKKIFCNQKIIIQNNEIVLIKGASGSGKSTFLQMLKGIIPEFTSGEFKGDILYNGNKLSGKFFIQNLSEIIFLFQNPFSQLIYPHVAEEFFFFNGEF